MRAGQFSFFRILLIFFVAALSVACSLPFLGADAQEPATPVPTLTAVPPLNAVPTLTAVPTLNAQTIAQSESTNTGPPPASTQLPTSITESTSLPKPTDLPIPTSTSTAEDFFLEEFDQTLENWDLFFMSGEENQAEVFTQDDRLTFYLDGKEIYAYLMYTPYYYSDVSLTALVENRGYNNNNVSLICRYDPEVGWYEFNIANNGLYWMLFFDIEENVYQFLADGGSTSINMGKAINEYTIVCENNILILSINGKETRRFSENKYGLEEGMVGVSVSSFNVYPIEVDFMSLEISPP